MPRKAKPWLRLYTEITDDQKIRGIPVAHRWVWVTVLVLARKSPKWGRLLVAEGVPVTATHVADAAKVPDEDAAAALVSFEQLGMVHRDGDTWVVTHFGDRQYETDDVTERVGGWRKGKKVVVTPNERYNVGRSNAQSTDVVTPNEILSNVDVTPPEYRVQRQRTETETNLPAAAAAPPPLAAVPVRARARSVPKPGRPPYSDEFLAFWNAYPRKVDKYAAWEEWQKRVKEGATPVDLVASGQHYAAYHDALGTEESKIKHGSTFLGPSRPFESFTDGMPPIRAPVVVNGAARAGPTAMAGKLDTLREVRNKIAGVQR